MYGESTQECKKYGELHDSANAPPPPQTHHLLRWMNRAMAFVDFVCR